MPIHVALGNHDYDTEIPRQTSLDLFRDKWGVEPWSAVDLGAWRILLLDDAGDGLDTARSAPPRPPWGAVPALGGRVVAEGPQGFVVHHDRPALQAARATWEALAAAGLAGKAPVAGPGGASAELRAGERTFLLVARELWGETWVALVPVHPSGVGS